MRVQVRIKDRLAVLVGDGQEAGAAIAAGLVANGARVSQDLAAKHPDLAVIFAQDGALPIAQLIDTSRRLAARMGEGGRMLNVVSVTGLVPMRGDDTAPLQAAAMAFTRGLALDLAPRGIHVNALAIASGPEAMRRMASHTPGGRLPNAAELVEAALFLLDPENSYTTGHVLVADGGWSIGYGRDF